MQSVRGHPLPLSKKKKKDKNSTADKIKTVRQRQMKHIPLSHTPRSATLVAGMGPGSALIPGAHLRSPAGWAPGINDDSGAHYSNPDGGCMCVSKQLINARSHLALINAIY